MISFFRISKTAVLPIYAFFELASLAIGCVINYERIKLPDVISLLLRSIITFAFIYVLYRNRFVGRVCFYFLYGGTLAFVLFIILSSASNSQQISNTAYMLLIWYFIGALLVYRDSAVEQSPTEPPS